MNNKYYICAKIKGIDGSITERFYAHDKASGGYPYFSKDITNCEVKEFSTLENAKKFLKENYIIKDGKMQFYAYYENNIVGFPYIIKTELKVETVYELT